MADYKIWEGVGVGESLPEGSQVAIRVPGKGLGKRPNINANKNHHTFEEAKHSRDQGDDMINVEVDHMDNEPLNTDSPPYSKKKSMMKPLSPLLQIFKPFNKGRQLDMIQLVKI
ncbi:hypothetical protein O181_110142 [Austropuccinia psidii MF-1]|uniref:Uncharacterized protein n=1 Tax=Austropuccinia psidii MF-1 TaxID=1389203 RepID=A0A9Q3PS27_9BASI|nr:hypothetical protein [Austropuccinia psidii MF-1]